MQNVAIGDNLHEMSKPIFWENKNINVSSAEENLKYFSVFFFFFFSPENRLWHFMQIVAIEDNLHELLKPIFWEK